MRNLAAYTISDLLFTYGTLMQIWSGYVILSVYEGLSFLRVWVFEPSVRVGDRMSVNRFY